MKVETNTEEVLIIKEGNGTGNLSMVYHKDGFTIAAFDSYYQATCLTIEDAIALRDYLDTNLSNLQIKQIN